MAPAGAAARVGAHNDVPASLFGYRAPADPAWAPASRRGLVGEPGLLAGSSPLEPRLYLTEVAAGQGKGGGGYRFSRIEECLMICGASLFWC